MSAPDRRGKSIEKRPFAWRLILDSGEELGHPFGSGAWNMVVDEALLESLLNGEGGPTLRIYGWSSPTVSLGRFQPAISEVTRGRGLAEASASDSGPSLRERGLAEASASDSGPSSRGRGLAGAPARDSGALSLPLCERLGLAVVRRPTGGRAVLHDRDVTYSVVMPHEGRGIVESYRGISEGLRRGLERWGIASDFGRGSAAEGAEKANCFASATRSDLIAWTASTGDTPSEKCRPLKLVGSAQCRRGTALLQHGSLPLAWDRERYRALFGATPEESGAGCLADFLEPCPGWEQAAAAIAEGFRAVWGLEDERGGLTRKERDRARALWRTRYRFYGGREEDPD